MESYLSGKGASLDASKSSSFSSYLNQGNEDGDSESLESSREVKEQVSEIIYDEKDCPKVEVISTDGSPTKIVIHLPEGKILEINCLY